jgi:hypothetical protein
MEVFEVCEEKREEFGTKLQGMNTGFQGLPKIAKVLLKQLRISWKNLRKTLGR